MPDGRAPFSAAGKCIRPCTLLAPEYAPAPAAATSAAPDVNLPNPSFLRIQMTALRRKRSVLTWIAAAALAVVSLAPASIPVFAASNDSAPRITQKIDDAHRVTLKGNVPAIA